jgi:outer membrane lipopolysaccharide assembly protein LptE/RlpB
LVTAGAVLAACGLDIRETRDEKRYVKICTQYIGEKYSNAEDQCRCQWKGIRKEVKKDDLDEFFFKLTAGRRFETKASKLIDRISQQCLEKLGPGE